MKRVKKLLSLVLSISVILGLIGCNSSSTETVITESQSSASAIDEAEISTESLPDNVEPNFSVQTINDIFADGQKVVSVALLYAKDIDPSSLSTDSYEVENRTITAIHTNCEAAQTSENITGPYVILDLEVQSPLLADEYATDGRPDDYAVIDSATVTQLNDISATDGSKYAASSQSVSTAEDSGIMGNDSKIYLTRDKFEGDHFYTDPDWKFVLHYNICMPDGYSEDDTNTSYPLVLFMPDAGAVSTDWETSLTQGNGGTVWATDDWQAGNPCFVVTMVYDDKFINDYWEYYENYVEGTMDLVQYLSEQYPIDTDRIYTTGQSMGGMCSLIMMSLDPDLFTAAYCVASKWDTDTLLPLVNSNILLLNAEDDPGTTYMDDTVNAWIKAGGNVAQTNIDGIADNDTLSSSMSTLFSQNANMNYIKITAGTGSMDLDGNPLAGSHRYTWRLAYDLPEVKEWLFSQSK